MKIKRKYKIGTEVNFKWYENWRDEALCPNKYRVISGIIEENTFLDEAIIYSKETDCTYAVSYHNIIN